MSDDDRLSDVYADRNVASVGFAEAIRLLNAEGYESYRSGWHPPAEDDDADADEWAIVWVQLPTGQATWHVPRRLVESSHLPYTRLVWDGHDRTEKNERVRRFAGIF